MRLHAPPSCFGPKAGSFICLMKWQQSVQSASADDAIPFAYSAGCCFAPRGSLSFSRCSQSG